MNWRLWVRGLIAAAINSATGAASLIVVDSGDFNLHQGLPKLASVAGALALSGALLYLKQHPLPDDETVSLVGR